MLVEVKCLTIWYCMGACEKKKQEPNLDKYVNRNITNYFKIVVNVNIMCL